MENIFPKVALIGLWTLVSAGAVAAQTPDTCFGFVDVMELAVDNDPAVTTSEARRGEARAGVDEAKSLYRPQISAFARTGAGDVGLIDSAIQNQVGLNASQRVIDFGDARLARRSARFGVQASDHDVRLAEQQAASSVSNALLGMLEANEAMVFTAARQQYFQDQLSAIEAVLEQGGATVSERAEVAAQLANAKGFLLDLRFQYERAQTILEIETGTQPNICEAPIVEAEFSTLGRNVETIQSAVDQALLDAPELKGLRARADGLAAQSERERRARLPIVSVVGSVAYSSIGSIGNLERQERVGLDVSVPLYTGNALGARSRRATAREAAARSEVAERRRDLEEEVRVSYRRTLSLEAQQITAQEFEDRSRELFEFAQIEYEAGTRTLPDLVDVRIEYEAAGLRRIGIKFEKMREQLRLLTLTGSIG